LGRDSGLTVTVAPDAQKGNLATIRIDAGAAQRSEIEAETQRVMKEYTMSYRIEWGRA
jgi:hypothetical protein